MSEWLHAVRAELEWMYQSGVLETIGLALAACLIFAFFSAQIARARGHRAARWFLAGVLFGPLGLVVGLFPVNQRRLDALAQLQRDEQPKIDPHSRSELGLSGRIAVGGLVAGLLLLMAISP